MDLPHSKEKIGLGLSQNVLFQRSHSQRQVALIQAFCHGISMRIVPTGGQTRDHSFHSCYQPGIGFPWIPAEFSTY